MEQHVEQALYEVLFALAEFSQANGANPEGSNEEPADAGKVDALYDTLCLSRWSLETALRSLRQIDGAQPRRAH